MSTKKERNIHQALFDVKKELGAVKKQAKNPFFKSNYADLNQHLDLVEPLLEKHGLVLTQPVITNGVKNMVSTEIALKETEVGVNGDNPSQVIKSQLVLPESDDLQKVGSAITYARRYTLGSLLGMQSVDDDGNVASGKTTTKPRSKVRQSSGF